MDNDSPVTIGSVVAAEMGAVDFDRRITGDLVNEYGTEEQLAKLYGALAKAAGQFGEVKKTADVSFGGKAGRVQYSYAPLAELVRAVRKPLADHGLVIIQPFVMDGPDGEVRTRLAHEAGGRLEHIVRFSPDGRDIKTLGGQTTYLARYALSRLCMLDGVEDADAHEERTPSGAASPAAQKRATPPVPPPEPAAEESFATDAQKAILKTLTKGMGQEERQAACREVTGQGTKGLTEAGAEKLIKHLRASLPVDPRGDE